MNSPSKAILIAMFAAIVQLSAPTSHAEGTLTISCAAPHLPSQQAVAKALDLHNFGQVYSTRDKLMRYVERACANGVTQVLVSNDNPTIRTLDGSYAGPRMAGTRSQRATSEPR